MNNVADLEHDPEPINRAIYWLVHLSWTNPDNFETLQELAGELQGHSQQQASVGLPITTSVVKRTSGGSPASPGEWMHE